MKGSVAVGVQLETQRPGKHAEKAVSGLPAAAQPGWGGPGEAGDLLTCHVWGFCLWGSGAARMGDQRRRFVRRDMQ